jgi:archaellum component FlaC
VIESLLRYPLTAIAEGKIPVADEVTKKDLQSLQGTFNKQIKEIENRLKKAEDNISILKDVPTKQDDAIADLYSKITDHLQKQIAELKAEVAAIKKK